MTHNDFGGFAFAWFGGLSSALAILRWVRSRLRPLPVASPVEGDDRQLRGSSFMLGCAALSWAASDGAWPVIGDLGRHGDEIGVACIAALTVVCFLLLDLLFFNRMRAGEPKTTNTVNITYTSGVMAAIAEEMMYRGVLQHWALVQFRDPLVSLFVVCTVFAVVHLYQGVSFTMTAGFLGMCAAVMTYWSGSLIPALILHLGWNTIVVWTVERSVNAMPTSDTVDHQAAPASPAAPTSEGVLAANGSPR